MEGTWVAKLGSMFFSFCLFPHRPFIAAGEKNKLRLSACAEKIGSMEDDQVAWAECPAGQYYQTCLSCNPLMVWCYTCHDPSQNLIFHYSEIQLMKITDLFCCCCGVFAASCAGQQLCKCKVSVLPLILEWSLLQRIAWGWLNAETLWRIMEWVWYDIG